MKVRFTVSQFADLIDRFVPGAMLLDRLLAAGRGPAAQLEARLRDRSVLRLAASVQQTSLFAQFTRTLQVLSRRHPLLLVLDDLQWADAGSTNLLLHLARRLTGHRILVLGAYRHSVVIASEDGQRHPLKSMVHELQREYGDVQVDVGQGDRRQFMEALLDTEPNRLGTAFRNALFRHTNGQPLFTVEFLRGLQERGDLLKDSEGRWVAGASLDWETLPPRVEAVIAERVGRLPQRWQALLAAASVEGETFSVEVLARVLASWRPAVAADEPEIMQCLSGPLVHEHRLVLAQGVEHIGSRRLSRYRFRHFLFQKYLYGKLDAVERAHLHESVAHELEALSDQEGGHLAVQLAWHYESAGNPDKAVHYLRQAGELAGRLGAPQEAIAHFQRGLQLLAARPDTTERVGLEISLLNSLGPQLIAGRGYAHPDVQQIYDRARALCRPLEPSPPLVPALRGLGAFYSLRAEYGVAHELYEQISAIAGRSGDRALLSVADRLQGYLAVVTGAVVPARVFLERALSNYDPVRESTDLALSADLQDPITACHTWLSWAVWALGHGDQALAHSRQARAAAETVGRTFDVTFALGLAATLHTLRHDAGAARDTGASAIAIASSKGFPFWLAAGKVSHGWAIARLGQADEGLAEVREGAEFIRLSGARQSIPWSLMLLAETLEQTGRIEEGLDALTEALNEERRATSKWLTANLLRLRGELLLRQGDVNESQSEACFRQAIAVAQDQGAKSWELRATESLCRLYIRHGRQEEACAMLAEICDWFTEGWDEPGLRAAKTLLDQLGRT